MSLCYCQFLRSSCCYGLLLCLPSVFVVVVVLLSLLLLVLSSFLLEMSWGGASASAVLMLLWFAALFASVGAFAEHSREISFAQQAFICTAFALVLLVVVVVVVVSVGDVQVRVSVFAVFMLCRFAALLASVGLAGGSVSAVFMLLWFAALLASVGLLGGSVSAVFMLLWFAALLASVGLLGGLCYCSCGRFVASCVSHGSIKRISYLCNAYAAADCALSSSHPTTRAFRFPCSACAAVGCALPCCIRLPITIAALQCMIFFSIGLLVLIGLCFFYRLETSAPGLSGYYWYIYNILYIICSKVHYL